MPLYISLTACLLGTAQGSLIGIAVAHWHGLHGWQGATAVVLGGVSGVILGFLELGIVDEFMRWRSRRKR